jgi:UDP-GlcNAc:undecaprenyl-phosphate/decaprenyl-phosphate GlcNAc-1-phosphate transferase
MSNISPYLLYIIIPILSALVCGFSIPRIIILAMNKKLYDLPDNNRKIHKKVVPNLGGVAIFFSYIIVVSLFIKTTTFPAWNYVVSASMILFVIGIKDDIISLTPSKKFTAQIIAAIITVYMADIRLHSLHGILGVHVLPPAYSIAFSIVGCIFVTNAFNLIDGIDGLAGTISVLCAATLGICLAFQGNYNGAYMAFGLMGAIIGFLKFNIAPARIFMGDSGSLFIGFTIAVLCIIFINSYSPTHILAKFIHTPKSALIVALSILFIPVFDSFRVFVTRIAKGHHPFKADRSHLHHYLLDLGFSHTRTVTTLVTANLLIIAVSLLVQDYNPNVAIAAILTLTFGLFAILYFMRKASIAKTEVMTTRYSGSNGHEVNGNSYKDVVKKAGNKAVALETRIPSIAQEGN